jgi:hypothetical protein
VGPIVPECRQPVVQLRVKRSLYARAVGYNYEAVKIFMPANREKPVVVPYIEHVPPDVTAGIFWMKNRDLTNRFENSWIFRFEWRKPTTR